MRGDYKTEQNREAWATVTWEDLATFIGPNAVKFEEVWRKMREPMMENGGGYVRGRCWPAFFFFFGWFFARKMWLAGAVLLIGPIVLGNLVPNLPSGVSFGLGLMAMLFGQSYYLQQAVPKVAAIVDAVPEEQGRAEALRAAGGISWPAALGSALLYALFIYGVVKAIAAGEV